MSLKTIKNVDERTWTEFKTLAVKNGVNMGKMLERLIKDYSERKNKIFAKIFSGKKILSDREALELEKTITKIRKERGFRE